MKKTVLTVCMLIFTVVVSAQENTIPSWLKPKFGSTNELVMKAGDGYNDITASTHSDLSATFNTGGELEFFVEYDLVKKQLCGGKLTYRPTDCFTLIAGIIKNPYISELSISPRNLEAIGYSMAASYLGGYGSDLSGISARGRDIGLLADIKLLKTENNFNMLRAQFGVFNGNGFSFRDNDCHKDLSGRIDIKPARYWTLALGGMYGKYSINDGRGISYKTMSEDTKVSSRSRASAALWMDDSKYFLRVEKVFGKTDGLKSDNFSALAGWWITPHLSPSARYETFIKDMDDSDTRISQAALCLTYKYNEDINLRFQYNHRWFANGKEAMNYVALGFNIKFNYK